MKSIFKINSFFKAASVFATAVCLALIISCGDESAGDAGVSPVSGGDVSGSENTVLFYGTISDVFSNGGALPEQLLIKEASASKTDTSKNARAAMPQKPSSSIYYKVTATGGLVPVTKLLESTETSFSIPLVSGRKWNVKVELKSGNILSILEGDSILLSDESEFDLSSQGTSSYNFLLKPLSEGSGTLSLNFTSDTTGLYDTITVSSVKKDGTDFSLASWNAAVQLTAASLQTKSGSSLAAGIYSVKFDFIKEGSSIPVFSTIQEINIFPNMTTNRWISDYADTDGLFCVTQDMASAFSQTKFFVNAVSGNNENSGTSPYSALQTLNAAFTKIETSGNTNADYTVYIDGTITGTQTVPDSLDEKAASVTLAGLNGFSGDGIPKDSLTNDEGATLIVSTSVPVTVRNLKLETASYNYYALDIQEYSKVSLTDGAYILGKSKGVNVYSQVGQAFCMSGSAVIRSSDSTGQAVVKLNGSAVVNVPAALTGDFPVAVIEPAEYTDRQQVFGSTKGLSSTTAFIIADQSFSSPHASASVSAFKLWNIPDGNKYITDSFQGFVCVQNSASVAEWTGDEENPVGSVSGDVKTSSQVFISGRELNIPDLYVCDHEVTQKEYETYCSYDRTTGYAYPENSIGLGDDYPAYWINWYDAIVYCNLRTINDPELGPGQCVYWLNGEADPTKWDGINNSYGKYHGPSENNDSWNGIFYDPEAKGYRLPTEVEWEYLARSLNLSENASDHTLFSGSNDIEEVAWHIDNANGTSHIVKEKQANFIGLYDMTGNVAEWCWDRAGTPDSETLITGSSDTTVAKRIMRGGGYTDSFIEEPPVTPEPEEIPYIWGCAVAVRDANGVDPYAREARYGFRVVRNK